MHVIFFNMTHLCFFLHTLSHDGDEGDVMYKSMYQDLILLFIVFNHSRSFLSGPEQV